MDFPDREELEEIMSQAARRIKRAKNRPRTPDKYDQLYRDLDYLRYRQRFDTIAEYVLNLNMFDEAEWVPLVQEAYQSEFPGLDYDSAKKFFRAEILSRIANDDLDDVINLTRKERDSDD